VNNIACQVPSGDMAENTSFEVEGSMHLPLHFVGVTRVHAGRDATSGVQTSVKGTMFPDTMPVDSAI
jgi:hypothetical protein